MSTLSIPNSFTAGSLIQSSQMNANFTAITTWANGNITNNNIGASAAIAYSKLNLALSIVNADISTSAAIAYSKLNLAGSIATADLASGLVVPVTKGGTGLTTITANRVLLGAGTSNIVPSSMTQTEGGVLAAQGSSQNPDFVHPGPTTAQNYALKATVATNNLTVALKLPDASTDASSTNGIAFSFVDLSSGGTVLRRVTSSLSITTSSTTFGLASGDTARLFVYVLDNAGTVELALSPILWDESTSLSTVAIASGTTRAQIYSTTARNSIYGRLIGTVLCTRSGTNWDNSLVFARTTTKVNPSTTPLVTKYTSSTSTHLTAGFVKYMRIRMVGGGGGGGGSGASGGTGGTGGNTTFGSTVLVANGGVGGAGISGGAGGTASIGTGPAGSTFTGATGQGGGQTGTSGTGIAGGQGASTHFAGGGGGGIGSGASGAVGNAGIANSGAGGGGAGSNTGGSNAIAGGGGGAGGFVDAIIGAASLLGSYATSVGGAGTAGSAGTNGSAGGAGGSGFIEVTEYFY